MKQKCNNLISCQAPKGIKNFMIQDLEKIENNRLLGIINESAAENEILTTQNGSPETFNSTLVRAILSLFSSKWACESLLSEMNFIKNK